jgi:hypothetical protein
MKVGDKVRRPSTEKYNDIVGTVTQVQGSTVWVDWHQMGMTGPIPPYAIPASELVVVQAAAPDPQDDTETDDAKETNGEDQKPVASKLPTVAAIAIGALLLWRGAK